MGKDLTTLFTGRHCTVLAEVESTNTVLAEILRINNVPEGSVIRALSQKAGRGQGNATWESESEKNLLLSFAFYPSFLSPKDVFLLNKTFALGAVEFLKIFIDENIKIKWPNDLYWKDKKLGGMLIENSINAASVTHCIFGIGINVNQTRFSEKLINPVSLAMIGRKEYVLEDVFNELCSSIETRYLQLKNGDYERINDDYLAAMYGMNELKNYETKGKQFKGKIRGVDEWGKLIIEGENNLLDIYELKEIKYLF